MTMQSTGLFIVRAWVEQGSEKTLRAHVRLATDISAGFDREVTLTNVADVCAAAEAWLRDVLTPT
jgi:predicted NBD/HSP70 family sugar kinase